jgi:hypothetical protein
MRLQSKSRTPLRLGRRSSFGSMLVPDVMSTDATIDDGWQEVRKEEMHSRRVWDGKHQTSVALAPRSTSL